MISSKKCRVCGNMFNNESLLNLPDMPGAVQNLPTSKDDAVASGVVLDVRQCSFCGLVQLINDPVPYHKDVIRPGGVSASMRTRQHDQFKKFVERFSLKDKKIIEIGSGRGEYLSILNELPVKAFGMEHNPEAVKIANDKGLKTFKAYPIDLSGPPDGIMFDAFISINVFEHVPDPGAFLKSCADFLNEKGVGMISVPDFEHELNDNYLFSFMSDHLSYFSPDTLRTALCSNGLEVIEIFKNRELNVITAYVCKRRWYDLAAAIEKGRKFSGNINNYMKKILNSGGRIAVWGASHLAFSIISLSKTAGMISYIVDSSPVKQGRFTPATGIAILPPEHLRQDPVDTVLIMCPEYSKEIAVSIQEKYSDIVRHIATFVNGELEVIQ